METKKGPMCLSENAATTSSTIYFFDEFFNSFNGGKKQGLNSIISSTSNHINFWNDAYNKLRRMVFVKNKTHKAIRKNSVKCLTNWLITIENSKYLWNVLKLLNFPCLNLKYLNQDVLENQVRDHGHRNTNPSPYQFQAAFKVLLTTNLTSAHSISSNCQQSEGKSLALLTMYEFAKESNIVQENDVDCSEPAIPDAETNDMFVDAHKIVTIIQKQQCVMQCKQCLDMMTHNDMLESVQRALDIAELKFVSFCYDIKVKEQLKNILLNEIFSTCTFHCSTVRNVVVEITATQFLLHWCTLVNALLSGKRVECQDNIIYNMAKMMHLKQRRKKDEPMNEV